MIIPNPIVWDKVSGRAASSAFFLFSPSRSRLGDWFVPLTEHFYLSTRGGSDFYGFFFFLFVFFVFFGVNLVLWWPSRLKRRNEVQVVSVVV